jgi:hypothetical protein
VTTKRNANSDCSRQFRIGGLHIVQGCQFSRDRWERGKTAARI